MLDLKPRVHLNEISLRLPRDELDRAGAHIADGRGGLARGLIKRFAPLAVKRGRGRLLDHLLVAALQRTFALEQRDDPAMRVAEHLHLDMARALDEFLHEQSIVAESGGRFPLCAGERGFELSWRF